ncbi:MAG: Glycosyltransferase involved in cell wall bisynthesis [Candidatus Fermentimicrarchaeum limneticum]|uniref:Glycosyltransferase involved in cell wall bisynthesis n=1 Tax=Fermentimicrarchaeum limneticum TaxID=2795018 RepID=A0A7D5XIU1_FERL1|nr:MAG: Glycosyltransferase involved in cell wall bisynthesis [Candidatus Fermentimicrarchaeum limneticum]
MEIHQTTPHLDTNDAIGNYITNIQKILIEMGFGSEVYTETNAAGLSSKTKNFRKLKDTDGIILHHFSIGCEMNRFINSLPNKKIIVYHNITPPEFYLPYDVNVAYICKLGLDQLKKFKNNVIGSIADSEFNKRNLQEFGFEKIRVLPIPVDFNSLRTPPNPEYYERFNDGCTNFLFVGRVVPNKKFEDVIRVFHYYNKYINSESRLLLVGSIQLRPYHEYLITLSKKLSIHKNVVFTDKISLSKMIACYKASDDLLCMSEHEGFCIPLLESMFFRIPIVAYNSTAVPYTLGDAGVLVNKKDYEQIAELINIINSDKSLRRKIIKKQTERLKFFDYRKTKATFKKIIADFVG